MRSEKVAIKGCNGKAKGSQLKPALGIVYGRPTINAMWQKLMWQNFK